MNIALLFGSKSPEHNISIITAFEAYNALQETLHKVLPVYITQSGNFLSVKLEDIKNFKDKSKIKGKEVHFRPSSPFLFSKKGKKVFEIDVVLIATHGTFGEDGILQGLLEMSQIPYTGSNVRSSAASMDKITMKKLFIDAGLNTVEYYEGVSVGSQITLPAFPLIVKPSNLGSSIGINIAKNEKELENAIEVALAFDDRVLIEKALTNFSEYNCAILGNGEKVITSEIEKPLSWNDFLTFEDKYNSKNAGSKREFPAKISDEETTKIKEMAKKAFNALGCSGIARVDFLKSEDGEIFINEINTIPGSFSNYLFTDISFQDILENLFKIAFEEKRKKDGKCFVVEYGKYEVNGCKKNKSL